MIATEPVTITADDWETLKSTFVALYSRFDEDVDEQRIGMMICEEAICQMERIQAGKEANWGSEGDEGDDENQAEQ